MFSVPTFPQGFAEASATGVLLYLRPAAGPVLGLRLSPDP